MRENFYLFADEEELQRESSVRQKCLYGSTDTRDHDLADKLHYCNKLGSGGNRKPCGSPACPHCVERYKKWIMEEAKVVFVEDAGLLFVTVLLLNRRMTDEEVMKFDPKQMHNSFGKQLRRAGIRGPFLGCLEMDYNMESESWLPHYHLVMMGSDAKQIEVLRKRFYCIGGVGATNNTAGGRQLLVRETNGISRQLSYTFKFRWSRIEGYFSPTSNRHRTWKYRLNATRQRLALRTLDRIGFNGFLFLYGLRRTGNKIVKLPVIEKNG
ncbi:MAG: hypothetical protein HQL55_17825 [Magnetococcales bacterium]|nr:hypothetical protein [Magnetococcales bacterium]